MKQQMLRILVVLPFYGGSLPIGQYCHIALKDLGHLVEVFDSPAFGGAFTALKGLRVRNSKLEELEASFLQTISQVIYVKATEIEADLVLCLAQAPVTRQVLKRFKRDNILTAMWFVEDFTLFTYWRSFAPYYDFFFVIQKEPFLEELKSVGVTNSFYLPMAALPTFHHPMDLSPMDQKKYGSDISFLGAGYPNRRIAFRQLTQFQFKIWGNDWDNDRVLSPNIQYDGKRVSPEDAVKIYNGTKININLHSHIKNKPFISNGDFVNPRTFEIASCEAFQLVDQRQLLAELFSDDEIATFTTIEELQEKIQYFLAHPEERFVIAERGRQRVLTEHTYQQRMKCLLSYISEHVPEWPKERINMALPDIVSTKYKEELNVLMSKLKIATDSSFEDIIFAIRQEAGVLSPLETSLLFLDEWRKLYKK